MSVLTPVEFSLWIFAFDHPIEKPALRDYAEKITKNTCRNAAILKCSTIAKTDFQSGRFIIISNGSNSG